MRAAMKPKQIRALALLALAWPLVIESCSWPMETSCEDGVGCVANRGGANGTGGAGGAAEITGGAAGSSMAGAEAIAGSGAESGAGGSLSLPCDGECQAPTAVCDPTSNQCVQCLSHADCSTEEGGSAGAGGARSSGVGGAGEAGGSAV